MLEDQKPLPPEINQIAIGDGNVQVAGDNNTVRQEVTNYIPLETEQKGENQNESQNIATTALSVINQTAFGNDNIQIIGNNNFIQRIINFFRLDTEQQRAMRNRRNMLELVKNTWIKGVLEKSLYNEILIQLGLEERSSAVDHPWDVQLQMPNQVNRILPPGTLLMEVFDELNGALLILGEPGAGKTTTLLELARATLIRAEQDDAQPIPVVFNLSSWTNSEQSLAEWLVTELGAKYYIPKKMAQGWVENDELLLMLDGLDEVILENREAVIHAINGFRHAYGLTKLAVCCRIAEYEALSKNLQLPGAIVLQPLTPEQIDQYFDRAGAELSSVRQILRSDPTLQELVSQPLMLSILTLAYRGLPAETLADEKDDDLKGQRKHLFDVYIQRMFQRPARTPNPICEPEQAKYWLAWLAQRMTKQKEYTFFLEEIPRNWLQTRTQIWLHITISGVFIGLVAGLIIGILVEPFGGLFFGLIVGLFSAAFYVLDVILGDLLSGERRSPDELKENIANTVCWGLVIGVGLGLVAGLWAGWWAGLIVGLIVGLITGYVVGNAILNFGLTLPKRRHSFLGGGAMEGFEGCGFLFLGVLVGGGLVPSLGLLGGMIGGLLAISFGWLHGWLIAILFSVVMYGLVHGGVAVINYYSLRLILWRAGYMPWNYIRFLDYCAERIFLRKVGSGYIFVHRLLMEHFAAMYQEQQ